jgi:branched-subunit amino acid transport protein
VWLTIVASAAVSFAIKAAGPGIVGKRQLAPWARGIIALVAPALLAALVVVDVFGPRWSGLDGPVIGGLAATAAAKLLRASLLPAVLVGVVTTALLRLALG